MRDLVKDIRKAQLAAVFGFGLLILVLGGWIVGRHTWKTTAESLLLLGNSLREKVIEQAPLFGNPAAPAAIRETLSPLLQKSLRGYAPGYYGGFYFTARHGEAVPISAGTATGRASLRATPAAGPIWSGQFKKTRFAIAWSAPRRAWTLNCKSPVFIAGRSVGFTFAGLALTGIIHYFMLLGLSLLGAAAGAILMASFSRRRLGRRIRDNLQRLSLAADPSSDPPPSAGYDQFERLAESNRRIHQELKEAAQSRAALLDHCPWGYAVFDATGKCVTINENGTAVTGLTPGSFIGGVALEWQMIAAPREEKIEIDGPVGGDVGFQRGDTGERIHLFVCSAPTLLQEGGKGLISWFIDTTFQKQREEKIRQLAAMVEYSADAIFGFGLNDAVTTWNQGAQMMYGYSAAEIIGKSHQILVPPELQGQMRGILEMIREDAGFAEFETERIRKDRVRIFVSVKISIIRDENGEITGFSTIHRDITDKRRYEVNLKAEREWLTVTLNSIEAGVIATDKFGHIVFINKNAARLTGWTVAEALEQPLLKILYLLDNQTSEAYEGLVAQVLSSENPVQVHNAMLIDRDLQEVPISISCTRIKTAVESFAGIVLVFQDITEKLKTEAELLRAEKLESLGILAGGIAHDFNNILAAVVANLQLAMLKLEKGMDINKYLTETVAISQRASELTKQLLTFSKGGAPVKKAASLVDLIQDTTRFVLHGSKVKAILEIDPDLLPVEVDEGQISQVIHNLIINANQAMPEGGIVRVHAENVFLEPGARYKAGSYVKIGIHDTGVGIPKEILHKIFDPYFTTKKDGNGLGLATTYSIIKKHDGYIEVQSAENVGTTFNILLPSAQTATARCEAEAAMAASFDGAKILLMDDEEVILKVVGEMMKYFGYKVTLARDGAEAIRHYQQAMEAREPYDAVVMDLTIPGGMGGPEAMTYLREIDPGVRAIVSSGYSNDPIMADYESYGFCGVVRKPYRFEELNQVLSGVVERRQLQLDLEYRNP